MPRTQESAFKLKVGDRSEGGGRGDGWSAGVGCGFDRPRHSAALRRQSPRPETMEAAVSTSSKSSLFRGNTSFRPEKKNWHTDTVLHPAGCVAKKYVGKEAVSMCAHRHQVAALLPDPFNNLVHWFAICQFGLRRNAHGLKLRPDLLQIRCVFGDFGTDCVRAIGPGCPSIGHV